MSRFLKVRNLSQQAPKKVELEIDAESGTPHISHPLIGAPLQRIPDKGIPLLIHSEDVPLSPPIDYVDPNTPPDKGMPQTGIPFSEAPISYPPIGISKGLSRIRRATKVQDGHSAGEDDLYNALWQAGHKDGKDSKLITIGYRQMGDLARLTVNNAKANIQSLIQKLAVEEVSTFTHSQGRTYRVLDYSAILQRRNAAGLTHYVKTRGVVFVDPDTGVPLTERKRDVSGIPFPGTPFSVRGTPERALWGVPLTPAAGIPQSVAPPYSQDRRHFESHSSPSELPVGFAEKLHEIVPFIDTDAVQSLWRQCRERAPECTPTQIITLVREKVATMHRGIQNPVGFLLTAIPRCFDGFNRPDPGRAVGSPQFEDDEEYWAQVAENEDATNEMRERARERIAALSQGKKIRAKT